ncbi:Acyl-CoA reductase [Limimonas halophila]|uniref:Acyl-CoA reductase n=1 Tax=Limimonas halophila TaxID=1082479 RepID=A0A1G7LJ71_9PROT|nr:aldehyde dehydrogenase family protein [Limimonas halophila]SDF49525.1 Acyl-CoA reductase [Limimonas halophila]
MKSEITCVSPIDGEVYASRTPATPEAVDAALDRARAAQKAWRRVPLERRCAVLAEAVDRFVAEREQVGEEITRQMGRPIAASPKEADIMAERARYMLQIAPQTLADADVSHAPGARQVIRREPVGVALVVVPWNYPYMTAVNSVWPALAAGNAVLHKPAAQTPLSAERFQRVLREAGVPEGLFQPLHMDRATTSRTIADRRVDFVAFTGSVGGGEAVQNAADGNFPGMGLELGGKDPGYVRADADIAKAVDDTVDGAFFNSGQSCCGLERLYVHADVYDDFVARFVEEVRSFRLGNPLDPNTSLGPMVRAGAADFVRGQIDAAVTAGATAHIDPADFPAAQAGTPYLAPQVLTDVDHGMDVMTEESFGPVVGIMKVRDDNEAVELMNDSKFGLTAAIWTRDTDAAERLGDRLETGTVYANKCDYLDPALAWVGVKQTGKGCTLSRFGYDQLTRPKSFNLHTA